MDKVGLVITTYNRPEYLGTFFDSLVRSDLSKLEHIVIVDDCSTDAKTLEMLRIFSTVQLPRVKLLKTEVNSKVHIALRTGIEYLLTKNCNLFMNIDPDCIMNKNWINKLLELHEQFPNDIVTGFNTRSHNNILKHNPKYCFKETIGGVNMLFTDKTYYELIKPTLISKEIYWWDWIVCNNIRETKRNFVVHKPSLIQHIGEVSTLNHPKADKSFDFIGE